MWSVWCWKWWWTHRYCFGNICITELFFLSNSIINFIVYKELSSSVRAAACRLGVCHAWRKTPLFDCWHECFELRTCNEQLRLSLEWRHAGWWYIMRDHVLPSAAYRFVCSLVRLKKNHPVSQIFQKSPPNQHHCIHHPPHHQVNQIAFFCHYYWLI